ncbi:hypothetical protein N7539_005456 [Penicillium diatomitis]|uniref:Uncharacterized protein n=1 Tax=Penicillium diatomitis TaxID=2819901 RepID=A0A9W9X6X8_9EURO|nr:uncharacterized protein N7539_005456 [Penicillium diatomitis]KAJ5485468.1 hypothetical protein N7539_005456 [Penicillium diatomitis]
MVLPPLNDDKLFLAVTTISDQFSMAYKQQGADGYLNHRNASVSRLGEVQIGEGEEIPSFVTIYIRRKVGLHGLFMS